MAVLVGLIAFFLSGMGQGKTAMSRFNCQQTCGTISVLVAGKNICCDYQNSDCLKKMEPIRSFCSGGCDKLMKCSLPLVNTGCGYDTTGLKSSCLTCDGENPKIGVCESTS